MQSEPGAVLDAVGEKEKKFYGSEALHNFLVLIEENEQCYLSMDVILSTIHKVDSLIKEQDWEGFMLNGHYTEWYEEPTIIKLLQAIHKNFDEINLSNENVIMILNFCSQLSRLRYFESELVVEVCTEMCKKLKKKYKTLELTDKTSLWDILYNDYRKHKFKNNKFMNKFYEDVKGDVIRLINSVSFLKSPADLIIILDALNSEKVKNENEISSQIKIRTLSAILDLKEWNDSRIFRNFLGVGPSPVTEKPYEDLLKKFLERTKQEILQNNKFIDDDFLLSFMDWDSRGQRFHDKTFDKTVVHNLINQLIERNKIKTASIRNICFYLHINAHSHDGFAKYLTNLLRENTNILFTHPNLSMIAVRYIAASNCDFADPFDER